MGVPAVCVRQALGLSIPGEFIWEVIDIGVNRRVPLEHFAGIRGHAAKDCGHGAVGAVFGFVIRSVIADCGEKIIVLLLVGVLFYIAESPGICAPDRVPVHITASLGADDVLGN